jgi:hypothetical protein
MRDRAKLTYLTSGIALMGAGLIAAPTTPPTTDSHIRSLWLASNDTADSPLGGGTAFVIGPSGISTPGPGYADLVDKDYLAPNGFTGTTDTLTTPEALYPFLGPFGETFDKSAAEGQQIVDQAVLDKFNAGDLSAQDPAVVFGYSQSAVIGAMLQPQLQDQGVPSDDVHFVLIGDESVPNGGLLARFDLEGLKPSVPSLGLTFSGAQDNDLYPTDVYTHEYDGFADFPQYPINFLSDLNALFGIAFQHTTYLGLTPEEIEDAIQLPTSADDTLTNYYMIPTQGLPLLDPLLLFGSGGKALYDLMEPDMRVLVNLGYGDIDHGYSPGDADVPTTLGFLPDPSVFEHVPQALADGLKQGVSDYLDDLIHPSNASPGFAEQFQNELDILPGSKFSVLSPVPTTPEDLFDTDPAHTGFPPLDVASALLITLPQLDYQVFMSELADGDVVDAIGIPAAADLGILPLALVGAIL